MFCSGNSDLSSHSYRCWLWLHWSLSSNPNYALLSCISPVTLPSSYIIFWASDMLFSRKGIALHAAHAWEFLHTKFDAGNELQLTIVAFIFFLSELSTLVTCAQWPRVTKCIRTIFFRVLDLSLISFPPMPITSLPDARHPIPIDMPLTTCPASPCATHRCYCQAPRFDDLIQKNSAQFNIHTSLFSLHTFYLLLFP